jgi:ribulose-phosphate 3-epimerase
MNVIPVINCPDAACARKKLEIAKTFLREGELVHLDVADGVFAAYKTWNDPLGWVNLKSPFGLEVHLMVEHPEEHVDNWLAAGARRLIVHIEAVTPQSLHEIVSLAERYHTEIMLSSKVESIPEEFLPYINKERFSSFQVLAVQPGPAGQTFLPFVEEKIRFLREAVPDAIIEVDGGMNPDTARLVKVMGADTIVSSNYIFSAADPKKAYEELRAI